MTNNTNVSSTEKTNLHPRNKHRERYNFEELIITSPELKPFVFINKYNDQSVEFSNPEAVKALNKALLKHFYGIENWEIPAGYLCPPIPGRADYIHYIADLLAESNKGNLPNSARVLDIGVGANCIYPIIGNREYGWTFVGSEIEEIAFQSATDIILKNEALKGNIDIRLQSNSKSILKGIIQPNEYFDVTICNPPFHASLAEAQVGTLRKLSNLNNKRITKPTLNFGGQSNELWCEGGEERFVKQLITESKEFASSCVWFTTLVSKGAILNSLFAALNRVEAVEVKTIEMSQGNKISRFVAWRF